MNIYLCNIFLSLFLSHQHEFERTNSMRICRLAITSHEHTLNSRDKNDERLRKRMEERESERESFTRCH